MDRNGDQTAPKRGRGRPRKNTADLLKPRGRPKKSDEDVQSEVQIAQQALAAFDAMFTPNSERQATFMATVSSESPTTPEENQSQVNVVKRGRGRPRKNPVDGDLAQNISDSSNVSSTDDVPDHVNRNDLITAQWNDPRLGRPGPAQRPQAVGYDARPFQSGPLNPMTPTG